MPELPEVEVTRRGISPHIKMQRVAGLVIRQPQLRWPVTDGIEKILGNKTLLDIVRRGKYLLLNFEQGTAFIHLGMSGSIRILDADTEAGKHDHFDILFSNGKILRYNDPRRFGAFLWAGKAPYEHKLLKNLGVEPLQDEFDADYLYQASKNRKIAIKQLIMNANLVVGVGNIYANEALFLAGIHPERAANRISYKRYARLVSTIKQVLGAAITQGGTTLKDFSQTDGKPGYFSQSLYVYGRGGKQCTHCGKVLVEIRQNQRSTVFCKTCQS